jgi:hypoxanthine phosphoribosyltransferase
VTAISGQKCWWGVSRGGWIPARVLSDILGNSNLASVRAENYVGVAKAKTEPALTQLLSVDVSGKRVLVVDDVADSGKSLQLVLDHVRQRGALEVKIATIYYKPVSAVKPDFYERKTERWVVFPWEIKETLKEIRKSQSVVNRLMAAGVSKRLVARLMAELEQEKC